MTEANKKVLIAAMEVAIAKFEGFYNSGKPTVAKRYNNPGNIRRWGSTPVWIPAPEGDRPVTAAEAKRGVGYAKFATALDGFTALRKQIEKNVFERRLTFFEFFAGKKGVYGGYAPSGDNNHPKTYATYVCKIVNDKLAKRCAWPAELDTVIAELFEGSQERCVR